MTSPLVTRRSFLLAAAAITAGVITPSPARAAAAVPATRVPMTVPVGYHYPVGLL
jgi:hypothetical protein